MSDYSNFMVVIGASAGGLEAHSYTASALLTSQSEKIEETLWVSLRMFEERKNLLNGMAHKEGYTKRKGSYSERAKETEVHIELIREMLLAPQISAKK